MTRRAFLALILGLGALACRKPDPVVRIQRVEVPVPVPCPAPPKPPRPVSHLLALPADATPDQKARAIYADLAAWVAYGIEQEALLDAYRPQEPKP